MGAWAGDGCSTKFRFISADSEIVERLGAFMETIGSSLRHGGQTYEYDVMGVGRRRLSPGREWVREHFGMHLAHTKSVPSAIFSGGPEAWAGFLAGYLDTDGCVPVATRCVKWSSASVELIRGCQDLLSRLGLNACISSVSLDYKGERRHYSQLTLSGQAQLRVALAIIGPHISHPKKWRTSWP
jgi:hypothetical protein